MNTDDSPRAVFERLSAGVSAGRWRELSALYAEDAVVDQPMSVPPAPRRLEGRAAIHARFCAAAEGPLELRARDVVVHETADPEVVIAEFGYDARLTTTGHEFGFANVQVLRVRDGLIVASRDYHDHLALAEAMGAAPGSR
jgi:ketosteroid isomerase-like protein